MAKKVDTNKEELEIAVKLLKASVKFINETPNRRLRSSQDYDTSYNIASDIDKFLIRYQNGNGSKES